MKYMFPVNPIFGSKLRNNKALRMCPNCKGRGSDPNYDEINSKIYQVQKHHLNRDESDIFIMNCLKCKGDGYIDWVENVRGKIDRDCKRPLMKNIRETSIYFLYSCLFEDQSYSPNFIYYSSFSEDYYINFESNFFNHPKVFLEGIKVVDKYVLPKDRRMLMMGIFRWHVECGYACTNCFKLIPLKYFKDKYKRVVQRIAMTPESELNYWELLAEEANYPIFILCEECYFKLIYNRVQCLKNDAFNSYNHTEFSVVHKYKLLDYLYSIFNGKYFDSFSEYYKMLM
jgi:hypothetical protein